MITNSRTADRWRRIVRRQRVSGLTVAAFCRQAGVDQPSFLAWRRKLRDEPTFAEVTIAGDEPGPEMAQADDKVATADGSAGIELRLPGQRCLIIRPGFDRRTLLDLLSALETHPADVPDMARREAMA